MLRTLILLLCLPFFASAQPRIKNKKYQGLLWEITGNGIKKPSYLFGTMHVSSKLAFHLADSFYVGIKNADVVALETNPESWQEDMSEYDLSENGGYDARFRGQVPEDYFSITTLKFYKYDKKLARALYSNPSTINNLLYRSYGNESSDFEEDTYLDMYIYQCGKKWGKKVAGVEKYGESMKLMNEAYQDAAKEKSSVKRSYSDRDEGYSANKLQDAYRAGNLDWLDSINRYNSFSPAFDEKFLYRRNEIQASSIDSILHSGKSLFVGVGAAHLPGTRGVIEILRKAGYTLRAVRMGSRDSQHKTQVDHLRVPVIFSTQKSDDGLYSVDIPGKFYKFGEDGSLDQRQYADMANGSYYMVTRIMTNSWMWGHNSSRVSKIVDSLLYENIPGRIISKVAITKNGYEGIDITNKTRRGDIQRYQIFTTPFEVVVFKMSGTGEYVSTGEEAKRFFGSIRLRDYHNVQAGTTPVWKTFIPPYGGFTVKLPHEPFIGNDGSFIFDAQDKVANVRYRIIRTDVHNYRFAEEDSFDLGLMDESFAASDFIERRVSRQQSVFKKYPSLDCQYRDKYGYTYWVKFIIQGPHYFTLVAHARDDQPGIKNFMESFTLTPYQYPTAKEIVDTSLFYTVKSPIAPPPVKPKVAVNSYGLQDDDEDDDLPSGVYRSQLIKNDTTGERIFVSYFRFKKYSQMADSSFLSNDKAFALYGDTSWIVRSKSRYELPNHVRVWEAVVSDTGSSRTLWAKQFYRDGIGYLIVSQSDSLTHPSAFVTSFYETFKPTDSLSGLSPFVKKSKYFFEDFFSTDSVANKRALKGIYYIKLDSSDLPQVKRAISSLNWNTKKYLDTKKLLIRKLEDINSIPTVDFLKELYFVAGDTVELQSAILSSLVAQKTTYAYQTVTGIISTEPPVLVYGDYQTTSIPDYSSQADRYRYSNRSFLNSLADSLQLLQKVMPDLLPLANLDDYKFQVMELLAQLIDSNMIKTKVYSSYFSKFLLEAKQELKKQSIAEKQRAIKAMEKGREDNNIGVYDVQDSDDESMNMGNYKLQLYSRLLMPFFDKEKAVSPFLYQLLGSKDRTLSSSTMLLLLQHGKSVADTTITNFAKTESYRYELYETLKEMKMLNRFPKSEADPVLLASSKLMSMQTYDKPDSLVFLTKLPVSIKGEDGYVYYFKYKTKKDDLTWRIANLGIVSKDTSDFKLLSYRGQDGEGQYWESESSSGYGFSGFGKVKLIEDQPLRKQLEQHLKKMVFRTHKSAAKFYEMDEDNTDESSEDVITVTAEPDSN